MRPPASIYPGTSVLRFVRTTPVTVLGSSHAGDGVGEECYLVDPASSHMLVSKIKPCMCCARASAGAGQPARASAGLGQAARAPVGSRGVSCARGGRQACAHSRPLPPSRFFRQVAKTLILKGGSGAWGGVWGARGGQGQGGPPVALRPRPSPKGLAWLVLASIRRDTGELFRRGDCVRGCAVLERPMPNGVVCGRCQSRPHHQTVGG
ncbi:hypothetical protein Salat_2994600 [Sesamum alatum]|uniref:Uncharacterized protein n=1 Tax=Sesamum alatum TaxID=300844 RepID=A0AAE2C7P2_9LAMI|nr:hypothetical protein Salat_2994600 [Sesamum alatum]